MEFSHEQLMDMYKRMTLSRIYDEKIQKEADRGRVPFSVHLYTGMEAIGVGIATALQDGDYYIPSHRSRPLYLRDCGMYEFMAEQYGLRSGYNGGINSDLHIGDVEKGWLPMCAVLGEGTPLATGLGFALKKLHPGHAVVQLHGDGAFHGGMVQEALNWAPVMKVPVVYVVENNFISVISTAGISRTYENISDRAKACGLKTYTIDGNDILEVASTMHEALEDARKNNTPSFVEMRTFRICEHGGSSVDKHLSEYYDSGLEDQYPDPIPRFEKYLVENKVATQEELEQIKADYKKEVLACWKKVYAEYEDEANHPTKEDIMSIKMYGSEMEGLR